MQQSPQIWKRNLRKVSIGVMGMIFLVMYEKKRWVCLVFKLNISFDPNNNIQSAYILKWTTQYLTPADSYTRCVQGRCHVLAALNTGVLLHQIWGVYLRRGRAPISYIRLLVTLDYLQRQEFGLGRGYSYSSGPI